LTKCDQKTNNISKNKIKQIFAKFLMVHPTSNFERLKKKVRDGLKNPQNLK
jgi:hypothetical protein